ncbi:acetyltransferase (GNAT) family protein [Anseongella ginsenosidimutans]|uniref:Acetyltransferase (GNAT) family protein n=1 Tax=Anseongella ginsenosidimutans TaxID=496056 RepID=A0A4R3KM67_9SPHI|nr:N-acetyltransferase [Anseongella ginsenosidimutans]QEC51927.1 GNAT family N-acetyltransferase [Anseongella ginsenosidimutans]TCS85045.1 acetyltransferase (GNAT) family protein [Anseongella ginsenosidimutans]
MAIKIAQASDEASAIDALTLAFSVDPMVRWSLPDPAKYLATFPSLARAFGGSAFRTGTAYFADGFAGVALWLPPGVRSDEESLMRLFDENTSDDVKEDLPGIFEQMEKFHPTQRHWYLPMIGVDPAYQGAGLGTALMTEALKVVDRDGLIAYLESSNPKNISLYERHGFEVIGEIQSGSSPVLRPMLRRAR